MPYVIPMRLVVRSYAREFVKDLEAVRPRAILDLIHSAETFRINLDAEAKGAPKPRSCQRCGYICSQVRTAS